MMILSHAYQNALNILNDRTYAVATKPIYIESAKAEFDERPSLYEPVRTRAGGAGRTQVFCEEIAPNDDLMAAILYDSIQPSGSDKEDEERLNTPAIYHLDAITLAGIVAVEGGFRMEEPEQSIYLYQDIKQFLYTLKQESTMEINRDMTQESLQQERLAILEQTLKPLIELYKQQGVGVFYRDDMAMIRAMRAASIQSGQGSRRERALRRREASHVQFDGGPQ